MMSFSVSSKYAGEDGKVSPPLLKQECGNEPVVLGASAP